VYPLLGCVQRPNWSFVGTGILICPVSVYVTNSLYATDIDDLSLQYAESNIEDNSLESRIRLHKSTPDGPLLPLDALGIER
jgi:23S rRNA (adenine1618-N6)-methyltransferase